MSQMDFGLVDKCRKIFLVVFSSVGVKHFWVDMDGMECDGVWWLCVLPGQKQHLWGGVYVILIWKA
jgi:hypothetical protein